MKCKAVHKKLIFFLDGDLKEVEMKQIQQHLNECGDCFAFVNEMEKTLGVLDEEKQPEMNPFFYTRLKARLENEQKEIAIHEKQPGLIQVFQPVFFSVLLLLGIYSGYKLAQPTYSGETKSNLQEEIIPYLNEMEAEPLEAFLME